MIPPSPKLARLFLFFFRLINIVVIFSLIISLCLTLPPVYSVSAQIGEPEVMPVEDEQWPQPDEPYDPSQVFYDRLVEHDDSLGNHLVEKPEERVYIPPSPESLALTQEKVDAFDCNTVTDVPVIECQALVALYASTNGAGWSNNTNWLSTTTVGNWRGVSLEVNNVTIINLWYNLLNGAIPPELGNLANLQELCLSGNQLTGAIPPELGNLSNLLFLDLYDNQLAGSIPPELGNLVNLQELDLSDNQLTNSIPPELGKMTSLQELSLYYNQLSGAIPPELGKMTSLQELSLHNNQLSGATPPELGNLANLDHLYLNYNQLTGSVPPELGNLSNLDHLNLDNNQLTGSIPPELGNLTYMLYLSLHNNLLSGAIPPELGNMTHLKSLELYSNQLNGAIPPELGKMTSLQELSLHNNQLSGAIPPELGNLANLDYLYLFNNQLTGAIPPELGNLTYLLYLILHNNLLSGAIPPELGNMAYLRSLHLYNNQLSGAIPTELGKMASLQELWLHNNQLSGAIPPELGNLIRLQDIFLYNNQLTGAIPPELGNLQWLLYRLSLFNNQLSGTIPPELGNLANLSELRLYDNQLIGAIPSSFVNLNKLYFFDFSNTTICEPSTPEFLAWKTTVSTWIGTGLICGNSTLSISGIVTTDGESPVSGVTINLYNSIGNLISSLTNNSDGSYSFAGLPAGTYTIIPSKSGYSFSPVTRSVTVPPDASGQDFTATPVTKPWLLMYYLAGDNNLSKYVGGFINTITSIQNENINVAIFDDAIGAPVRYIGFNTDGSSVEQKSELNTGDPQTLIDFITWAKANYPAHHTALIIFDHGNALSGVAQDESSDDDELTPPELKQAFSAAGGVDVLQMFACLMANLEAQYQLRGFADYYIGIENLGWPANYFNEYIPDITSETQPIELAVKIAEDYSSVLKPLNEREISERRPSTISVVDMSKIDKLTAKTSAMADVMSANWLETSTYVWNNTDSTVLQRFDSYGDLDIDNDDLLADLYHFALLLSKEQKFYVAAHDVMMALEEYIVYEDHWYGPFEINGIKYEYDLSNSHGVSIGLPRYGISYYTGNWLDFAEGANWVISPWSVDESQIDTTGLSWGAFVSDLVKEYNPTAPDSPNPPDLVSPLINDTPIITNISPARVLVGSSDYMLTVDGVGFMTDSVINWNGVSLPTTYVSGTKLKTQLLASDLEAIGLVQITVTTPGVEDGTSNEYEFVITDHLPDSDEKMTTSKVTFSWVPVENAIKYKLQVSTKPDFSVLLLNVKVTEPTYFFNSILQFNKTYYWRIRPLYAESKGAWLPIWKFSSMDALAKPTLTYPDHKQTLATHDVTLVWDPVENADQYKVVIAKDALFQNKVTSLKTANASATFALPDGKYFWRVRALDLYGAKGPWSDYRKFTVDAE